MTDHNQPESNASLTQQSIEWIKRHQTELTKAYVEAFKAIPSAYYQNRTEEQHLEFASRNINGLIGRLEGKPYNGDRVTKIFEASLEKGVSFQDLQLGIKCMQDIFIKKLGQDVNASAEIQKFLNGKIDYISSLFIASLAAASINHQTSKYQTKKRTEKTDSKEQKG